MPLSSRGSATLGELLAERAIERPDSTALWCGGFRLTYAVLDAISTAGAGVLLRAGVCSGDRVVLDLANTAELPIAYFACFKAGAVAVPVPRGSTEADVRRIVDECQPCVGLSAGADGPGGVRWLTVDGWHADTARRSLPLVAPDDPAVIVYTSGTTGWEKAVLHSHRTLLGWLHAVGARPHTGETVVVSLPLVHAYAVITLISRIAMGETVVLLQSTEADGVLDAIDRYAATTAIATPAMANALAHAQERAPRCLGSLNRINVSGDVVPVALQARFARIFGPRMRRTYGSTEVAPIAIESPGIVAADSLGFVCQGVDVRLINEAGRDVDSGDVGEIVVRSPSTMLGYWRDPEATALALRDRWFHTGDLARAGTDGRLYFAGRRKELIVRAGRNISPRQVEDALRQHAGVRDVAVWGLPDEALGQRVAAWVVPTTRAVSADELRRFAQPLLAEHKWPEQVFLVDALPTTAVGKVNRRALA